MKDDGFQGWKRPASAVQFSDASGPAAVAASLGISERQLAAWVEARLVDWSVDPTNSTDEIYIQLNDAALLRSLCAPSSTRPHGDKLRSTLDRLRACLPTSFEPMRRLTLLDRGGPLLIRLAGGRLADPSEQFRLDSGDDADAPLGRICARRPTTAKEWHEHGVEQERRGRVNDAVASYTRALLIGGPDVQITFDLAYAFAELGRLDCAIERYRQVVELDPRRQDAWVNLGDLLVASDRCDQAVDALRRALDLDPDDAAAHYNIADALDRAGDAANAANAALHWEAFVRLAGESSEQLDYANRRLVCE